MRPLPPLPGPVMDVPGLEPPLRNDFFPVRPINIGGGGIESLLRPLLDRVNSGYQQDVVQPYVQQVEELTTSTFPDINFGNGLGSLFPIPTPQPRPGGLFPIPFRGDLGDIPGFSLLQQQTLR